MTREMLVNGVVDAARRYINQVEASEPGPGWEAETVRRRLVLANWLAALATHDKLRREDEEEAEEAHVHPLRPGDRRFR